MKKVLIITYYWPPSGSSGVQRVLKFAKYLHEFGWQPIVLTVNSGQYNAIDASFVDEIPDSVKIYRTKAVEPHTCYKIFTRTKNKNEIPVDAMTEKNVGWGKKIAFWIRVNLFIPDARIGWIPFAVKEGKRIIKNQKIDLIFSSSPPPTVHIIAKKLSKWSGLKWVADFRDPWTNIHYFEHFKRFFLSEAIDEKLERSVLRSANAVTSVSKMDIEVDYYPKAPKKDKFYYIPNGYDEDDFKDFSFNGDKKKKHRKINITHIGTIGEERIPISLLKAVAKLKEQKLLKSDNFTITFIGKIIASLVSECEKQGIEEYIKIIPYVPHKEIFTYIQESTILLLLITNITNNRGIVPGKTFEYLRSGKSLLVFGAENGEVASIITKTKSGNVIDYGDFNKIYKYLERLLTDFADGKMMNNNQLNNIEMFARKNLTRKLVDVFDLLISV